MKKLFTLSIMLFTLCMSCKKDDSDTEESTNIIEIVGTQWESTGSGDPKPMFTFVNGEEVVIVSSRFFGGTARSNYVYDGVNKGEIFFNIGGEDRSDSFEIKDNIMSVSGGNSFSGTMIKVR